MYKIEEMGRHHADRDTEKLTNILIIKLILRDKINEAYAFLDKVRDILKKTKDTDRNLESLFKEYE